MEMFRPFEGPFKNCVSGWVILFAIFSKGYGLKLHPHDLFVGRDNLISDLDHQPERDSSLLHGNHGLMNIFPTQEHFFNILICLSHLFIQIINRLA